MEGVCGLGVGWGKAGSLHGKGSQSVSYNVESRPSPTSDD